MYASQPTILIVTRQTRLQGLRARWVTDRQAKFRLKQARALEKAHRRDTKQMAATAEMEAEADFEEYVAEDDAYKQTIERLERDLQLGFPVKVIDRAYVPTYDFWNTSVVVVVGQDGLVANTAKYAQGIPIVAVNPDPSRFDGILLPFQVTEARQAVRRVLDQKHKARQVTLAEVTLNDGQSLLAFNDFFIGASSHVSARYMLEVDGQSEAQSSSGIIISTGAGSTGWLSSVFNMARGLAEFSDVSPPAPLRMDWEDPNLAWVVREPFASRHSQANLVAGLLEEGSELIVESLMPDGGVIFSDGIESDYLPFASGTIARIRASEQKAQLVVGKIV